MVIVDIFEVSTSTPVRRIMPIVASVVLIAGAADTSGGPTVILPLLCLVAMGFAFRRARLSALDAVCWRLGFFGLLFGFLGYVCLAAGLP